MWGDGSDQEVRRQALKELAYNLKSLGPDAEVNKYGSDDLRVALHEEDSRGVVLWAVLREFLSAYVKAFPEGEREFPDTEIKKSIDCMLEAGEFFLSQQLIKNHIKKLPPLNLSELASCRYDRKRNPYKWERYKIKLTQEIFDNARNVQLWHIQTLTRDDNGGGCIAGYRISAGQALIDFNDFVFQPLRRDQYRRFYHKYLKDDQGDDDA